ncbi:hypothetical protein A3762_15450 [Oleiphilus sp. HI0125]|nr:hypothetical protein A3762_16310 [Oleiphilus sp. HI0125]KZZ60614.1 hypothetical protein A3762_15450 [Oleiphilus sp. HI0125]
MAQTVDILRFVMAIISTIFMTGIYTTLMKITTMNIPSRLVTLIQMGVSLYTPAEIMFMVQVVATKRCLMEIT